jgi:hypothetical protein
MVATRRIKYEEVGYIKYTGRDVERGVIDAGSAGSALLGLDEALRYFNAQQSPDFATLQYEIPVQTRPGSWEAIILAGLATVAGGFALGYTKKAGEKMAENDFSAVGMRDVLRKSLDAMKTLAKVVKHTRRPRGWEQARFSMDSNEPEVVLLNDQGAELRVSAEYFKWFQQMPPRLLVRMTTIVRKERVLSIGLSGDGPDDDVQVLESDKSLFEGVQDDEIDDDFLFPELIHGNQASLEGRLIRGNETTNSVGLEYQGHIINCVPASGSVRKYKAALFLRCKVHGRVNRLTKSRFVADRRPTLVLDRVVPLEKDKQKGLF